MQSSNLKLVSPVIPAVEAAVARYTQRNPLAVSHDVLATMRRKGSSERKALDAALTRLFSPAEPFKGVLPPGQTWQPPKMAMDSTTLEVVGWASQWAATSSLAEGQGFIGYSALSELAQRPEYRAIVEVIAYEMTREGIELKATGGDEAAKLKGDKIAKIEDELKRLHVMDRLGEAAAHDGFFGRSHIYLDTGDTDDLPELKTPLGNGHSEMSQSKVSPRKPLQALRTVEPVWTYPTQYNSNNPLKRDWYKPTSWFVMGTELHESRLLTMIGREVPDLLKPAYSFGGLSMTQMAMPYVQNWLRTRQAVADLLTSFTTFVLKTNLSESMQADGQQLFNRAELFNVLRSNQGLMLLDKDLEDFLNVSASIAGLEGLQAQAQEHLAAVSRIPIVKLLGIQPAGLNASSEGEIRSFYDWIHSYQEHFFRDTLDRIINFVQLSLYGEIDTEITWDFRPLWQLDELGEAGLRKTEADTHDAYIAMGAVSAEEVRQVLAEDKDSPYAGLDLSVPLEQPTLDPSLEPDPFAPEGETSGAPLNVPKPRDPRNALASGEVSKAEKFGSPVTGGFPSGDSKLEKTEVDFEDPARGPHCCGECRYFEDPSSCDLVAGLIKPVDWCKLFEDKSAVATS